MKHSDYITHINNEEDVVYLRSKHFPVNMRLFRTSPEYKAIILQQCDYIRMLCITEKEGYSKPRGMSSANAGLAFNIIGVMIKTSVALNTSDCHILINPKIVCSSENRRFTKSNCGSLTLTTSISVRRFDEVEVDYYDEQGNHLRALYSILNGGGTLQHEIDHNNGILITDY